MGFAVIAKQGQEVVYLIELHTRHGLENARIYFFAADFQPFRHRLIDVRLDLTGASIMVTMPMIDFARLLEDIPFGDWVALSEDGKAVIASGPDRRAVLQEFGEPR